MRPPLVGVLRCDPPPPALAEGLTFACPYLAFIASAILSAFCAFARLHSCCSNAAMASARFHAPPECCDAVPRIRPPLLWPPILRSCCRAEFKNAARSDPPPAAGENPVV